MSALDGDGWPTPRPGRFISGKENRYPLYRRPGGPQYRSARVQNISSPPGLDPRTVQPVPSRYTDYTIRCISGVNANRNKIITNGPTPKIYTTLYRLTNAGLWTFGGEFLCLGITQSINTSCYNTRLAIHLHNSWTADGQWIYSCYTNVMAAINSAQFVFTWQRQLAMRNVLIHFHCCVQPLLVTA
jgi:hypothetical protein